MIHREPPDEVFERAALYALGALPPDERRAFEKHLAEGCLICQREVEAFSAATGALGAPAASAALPAIVRTREAPWESTEVGGLARKPLFTDARDRVTALVRMAAGIRYPGHRHADTEELFMLSGDLTVSGERLGPGDYCGALPGSVHDGASTERGCSFFLVASAHDAVTDEPRGGSVVVVRARERGWRKAGREGVTLRPIFTDPTRGTTTAQVRVGPETRLALRRDLAADQLFVLDGEARVAGNALRAGDYYRCGPLADAAYSERGCEFLLICSAVLK